MCNASCMGREMLFPRREHHFAELIIIQEDDTFGPRESPREALQSLDDHSCNQIRGNCDCDTNNISTIRYLLPGQFMMTVVFTLHTEINGNA